jgi:hypothetical protein
LPYRPGADAGVTQPGGGGGGGRRVAAGGGYGERAGLGAIGGGVAGLGAVGGGGVGGGAAGGGGAGLGTAGLAQFGPWPVSEPAALSLMSPVSTATQPIAARVGQGAPGAAVRRSPASRRYPIHRASMLVDVVLFARAVWY